MEATRFGFDPALPRAYKFDPTDADLVAFYLIPRALRLPNPHDHAVIVDDPASCPPWELLRRNNHADSDHAFFFGPVPDQARNGGRKNRAVPAGEHGPGGTWRGQKGREGNLVLARGGGAGEMEFRYVKYELTYYSNEAKGSSGWVMHEYQITSPPLPHAIISRVKITDRAKKHRRLLQQQQAAAAARQFVPFPYQPGPSNYLGAGAHVAGDAVMPSNGEASCSGSQNDTAHRRRPAEQRQQQLVPFPDQPGPSNCHVTGNGAVSSNGEASSSGAQNDVGVGQQCYFGVGKGYGLDDFNNYFTEEVIDKFLGQGDGNGGSKHREAIVLARTGNTTTG
ncbi:hypothetical protein ACP4OV_014640 [Aristida adscensionis]